MEQKPIEKQLDEKVEEILATDTVSRAQEVMGSQRGLWFIALVSFLESATPLPIVTDPFMMAAILINRANYIRAIVITTISSVMGGVVAYFTAVLFLDVALDLLSPDAAYTLATMTASESENIFILSLIGAFTPSTLYTNCLGCGRYEGRVDSFYYSIDHWSWCSLHHCGVVDLSIRTNGGGTSTSLNWHYFYSSHHFCCAFLLGLRCEFSGRFIATNNVY